MSYTMRVPVVLGSSQSIPASSSLPPGTPANTIVYSLSIPSSPGKKIKLVISSLKAEVMGSNVTYVMLTCSAVPGFSFNNIQTPSFACVASVQSFTPATSEADNTCLLGLDEPISYDITTYSGYNILFSIYSATANGVISLLNPNTMSSGPTGCVFAEFIVIFEPENPTPTPTPPTPTPNPFASKQLKLKQKHPKAKPPVADSKGNLDFFVPQDIVIRRGQNKFVSSGWYLISIPSDYQIYVIPSQFIHSKGLKANPGIVTEMLSSPIQGQLVLRGLGDGLFEIGVQIASQIITDVILPEGSLLVKAVSWLASKLISIFSFEGQEQQPQIMEKSKRPRTFELPIENGPFKKVKK